MSKKEDTTPNRATGDRYRYLFENSADPILIIEGDAFTDCNQAAVNMLGYTDKASLLSRHPSEISPEFQPDGRKSEDKANEILASLEKTPYQRFEWIHLKADGTEFPVEVALLAVPSDSGTMLHTTWRDISDRKLLEEELRHAQKMDAVGKLAGGIAHDFNNQLVPILGYSDMLADMLDPDTEPREWAVEINRAASFSATLVNKLLAFSRKESSAPVVSELGEIVTGLLSMLRKLIGEDITIELHEADHPLHVRTGPGDVEQVLLNLASNSRDALPGGGTISITLSERKQPGLEFARIRVEDDGLGMDEETLARVFDPFFTTKELGSGTGLGMSTVYSLVSDAGGKVSANSELGRGTVVDVLLPLVDAEEIEATRTETRALRSVGENNTRGCILVIEDDGQVAQFVERVLEQQGYEVRKASNAKDASDLLVTLEPSLILIDVILKGMSGPDFVDSLRATGSPVPVLFMSGYTDDRLAKYGFDPANVPLIRKPFLPRQLIQAIESTLANWTHVI